jgi:hypothetical protein
MRRKARLPVRPAPARRGCLDGKSISFSYRPSGIPSFPPLTIPSSLNHDEEPVLFGDYPRRQRNSLPSPRAGRRPGLRSLRRSRISSRRPPPLQISPPGFRRLPRLRHESRRSRSRRPLRIPLHRARHHLRHAPRPQPRLAAPRRQNLRLPHLRRNRHLRRQRHRRAGPRHQRQRRSHGRLHGHRLRPEFRRAVSSSP